MVAPNDAGAVIPFENGQMRAFDAQASVLKEYLADTALFEIVVNEPGVVWVEGREGWKRLARPELTYERLLSFAKVVANLSHQSISEERPLLSATLPGGERIQIVIPPAVPRGTVSLTIRKPSQLTLSLDDLFKGGLFDEVRPLEEETGKLSSVEQELLDHLAAKRYDLFFKQAVLAKKNIIIAGSTGSGKTTLSKALIRLVPDHERLITIEDTPELEVPQPNHTRLFYSKGGQGRAKVSAKDLLESCLRMRPDRIFLGELRDGTAFDYIRNVNSGHPGSITTVHAESAKLAFEQLTLLVKESESGRDLERDDIRNLLHMLVDIVVQQKRVKGRFRVTEIYFDPERRNRLLG